MQNAYDYLNLMDEVLDGPEESIIIVNLPERHSAFASCAQQPDAPFSARAPQQAARPRRDGVF
ncbi:MULTISPECIES: hypothetical protein [Pantoea]|uniref:hypothetical protein n=1 Tax=Pantoea TaxID=53335 RepID=UPI0013DE1A9B|nr:MULTISPECIES: hypothetical protein [Pantoea]MEB6534488.1 hypothetical protein [Pantoea stewartii]QIE99278.1 hypothetical protein G5574_21275 [Pantoea stewartii]WRH21460.1 hypothetical protein GC090_12710 [Pantoea sp. JZ29]